MKIFFILFLFGFICCSTPPLPGIGKSGIAKGYNLVLDKEDDAIVKLTYICDEPWYNPYDGNKMYCVPDEVSITNIGQTTGKEEPYFFKNISDYSNQVLNWFDISNKTVNGTNSVKGHTDTITNYLKSGQYSVALQYRVFYLYSIKLWPGLDPISFFTMALENLPTRYDSTEEKIAYRNFIKQFGTHIVTRATFGGRFEIMVVVENSLFSNKSSSWIQAEINKAINIAKTQYINVTLNSLDEEFRNHSKIVTNFIGGDPTLISQKDGYTKWLNSIPANPAALKKSLEPYANRDYVKDTRKRDNLLAAIQQYLNE